MIKVNKESFVESQKKINNVVLEVTTKQLYVIPKGYTHQLIEGLKKEWFVVYENKSHAFKDSCLVQFSNNVIKVKEL